MKYVANHSRQFLRALFHTAWCELQGGVKAQIGQKWVKLGQEMAESLGDGVCPWCDVFYGEKSKFGVTHCFVS